MEITSPRHAVEQRLKRLEFESNGEVWFSFDTDDNIQPKFDPEYEDCQRKSWERCLNSVQEGSMEGPFARIEKRTYIEDAKGICECGREIELYDSYQGASQCPYCGRWHNLFGQQLINPEYWEDAEMYGY